MPEPMDTIIAAAALAAIVVPRTTFKIRAFTAAPALAVKMALAIALPTKKRPLSHQVLPRFRKPVKPADPSSMPSALLACAAAEATSVVPVPNSVAPPTGANPSGAFALRGMLNLYSVETRSKEIVTVLLHFVSSLSPKVVLLYILVSILDIVTQGTGADNRSALEGGKVCCINGGVYRVSKRV